MTHPHPPASVQASEREPANNSASDRYLRLEITWWEFRELSEKEDEAADQARRSLPTASKETQQ